MDIPPLSFRDRMIYIITSQVMLQQSQVQRSVILCSRGEWPWSMNRNEKPKVAWEWLDGTSSVCARFILARLEFDSELSASHDVWDCLIPFLHRVISGTMMISIWLDEVNSSTMVISNIVELDRCIPRMVNSTRIWKLKLKLRTYSLWFFQEK